MVTHLNSKWALCTETLLINTNVVTKPNCQLQIAYVNITPCPKKEATSILGITLTNLDIVSQFLALTILRTKKIESLFQILSHNYATELNNDG